LLQEGFGGGDRADQPGVLVRVGVGRAEGELPLEPVDLELGLGDGEDAPGLLPVVDRRQAGDDGDDRAGHTDDQSDRGRRVRREQRDRSPQRDHHDAGEPVQSARPPLLLLVPVDERHHLPLDQRAHVGDPLVDQGSAILRACGHAAAA
jgi:hypothetical protein